MPESSLLASLASAANMPIVGHFSDLAGAGSDRPWLWPSVVAIASIGLTLEHLAVAHGGVSAAARAVRRRSSTRRAMIGAGLVVALASVLVPAGQARSAAGPLPDLISDPPNPSFTKEIYDGNGERRLVVTFDGYVHNIGEGPLDVEGNPQVPGGMQQRVDTGDGWEGVGAPTVRFETDDGHNHFHLISAIEYVLWNELLGSQTADSSKVGFCLVDSEQMEPGVESFYSEEAFNFCQEGQPDATSLRMGITPGWRDIYNATTTLQWVDISNVAPGRYWLGAITDPNDEIVESNEANNALIYSDHTLEVPGFAPRSQPDVVVEEPTAEITLTSMPHGDVTTPLYTIERGPVSGRLDVPVGVDLENPVIVYRPDPGFEGHDEIEFSVHDANSRYPFEHPTVTVGIDVRPGATADGGATDAVASEVPVLLPPDTFFEVDAGAPFELDIPVLTQSGASGLLYARGLPPGLVAHAVDRTISGAAVTDGVYDVELIGTDPTGRESVSLSVTILVDPTDADVHLVASPDRSSPRGVPVQIRLGAAGLGLRFEADGLPRGTSIDPNQPVLVGTPMETGTWDVHVRQVDGDRTVAEISFSWKIRRTTDIAFPL